MLRTCKHFLSEKSLKTLYYAMIHCHLVYGNSIWGSAANSVILDLVRKQKAAIRIITGSGFFAHTEPLFKKLNILPLPSLIDYFKLQFMQQYVQGFLPASFNNTWVTNEARRAETVAMTLRNHNNFFVPVSRLLSLENMPLYAFPKAWISLQDHNLTILRSRDEFNTKLKEYLLSQLSPVVNCTKAYCPSCNRFLNN
jgi:hypothetical protein